MWAVAQFTLLKMRESAFYMLMMVSLVICVFTNTADPISEQISKGSLFSYALSGETGALFSMGSCVALIISILISSFYGASEIPADISSGVIMVILSKPVGRFRYLAGKYFSVVIMAYLIYFLMQLAMFLSTKFLGIGIPASYATVKSTLAQLVPSLLFLPLISINMFCSISAGALGAMIFTGLYFLFSIVMAFVPLTIALFPEGMAPVIDNVFFALHFLFINPLFYFQEGALETVPLLALGGYSLSILVIFLLWSTYILFSSDVCSNTK